MGIQGLTKLLSDHAPSSIKEQKFESYLDRKVAIDASMHIYQFMVRVLCDPRFRLCSLGEGVFCIRGESPLDTTT